MKYKLVLFLLLFGLIASVAHAQVEKIVYKHGQIFVNKVPIANMVPMKSDKNIPEFMVSSLSGKDLIYVKAISGTHNLNGTSWDHHWVHEFKFVSSGRSIIVHSISSQDIAERVVQNKLIRGNEIDEAAERKFTLADINTGPPISIQGTEIRKGTQVIGSFTDEKMVDQQRRMISVFNSAGDKIAVATTPLENPQEWSVHLSADGSDQTMAYKSPGEREKLFRWLFDNSKFGH